MWGSDCVDVRQHESSTPHAPLAVCGCWWWCAENTGDRQCHVGVLLSSSQFVLSVKANVKGLVVQVYMCRTTGGRRPECVSENAVMIVSVSHNGAH